MDGAEPHFNLGRRAALCLATFGCWRVPSTKGNTLDSTRRGGRVRLARLVGRVASGFQRCNVPVHKDNILAGFGRTRVKFIVIEKERILGIDWLRREDLRAWQALLVIIGIKTSGNSQLPKIVHASRVIGFGLRSAQSWQQQARQDGNDGDHNKQFNESEGATRARED